MSETQAELGLSDEQRRQMERKTRNDELLKQFTVFFKANPMVWKVFQRRCFDKIQEGRTYYSAAAVAMWIRWDSPLVTKSDDSFKINNNHIPFFARLFMIAHSDQKEFFTRRVRPSEKDGARGKPDEPDDEIPSSLVTETDLVLIQLL